jgi:hypothetical protein
MELEGSLLPSQAPATHPYPEPDQSSLCPPTPTSWREENLSRVMTETLLCAALGTASCPHVYRYVLHVVVSGSMLKNDKIVLKISAWNQLVKIFKVFIGLTYVYT